MRISELLRLVWMNLSQNKFKVILTAVGMTFLTNPMQRSLGHQVVALVEVLAVEECPVEAACHQAAVCRVLAVEECPVV